MAYRFIFMTYEILIVEYPSYKNLIQNTLFEAFLFKLRERNKQTAATT
jgi:hypothetical protein